MQSQGVTRAELCLGLASVRVDLHFRSGSGLNLAMRTNSRHQNKPTNGYSCGVNQYFQATSHLFQKDGVFGFAKRTFRTEIMDKFHRQLLLCGTN